MAVSIEVDGLSQEAQALLRRSPDKAAKVAAAAIEEAARRHAERQADPPEALYPYVDEVSVGPGIIGPSEAARRLSVSRQTVYDWALKGSLMAWRTSKRGLKIPAEQILGSGRLVPGVDRVLTVLVDAQLAWAFLDEEQPFADRAERPIDKLKRGDIDDVVGAAESFGAALD